MNTDNKKVNLLLVFESLALVVVLVCAIMINISKAAEGTPSTGSSPSEIVGSEDTEESSGTENLPEDTEGNTENKPTFSASVEAKLASMTVAQKVAQLFVVTPEQLTGVDQVTIFGNTSKAALDTYPVAGMVYSSLNYSSDEQLQSLVGGAKDYYLEKNGVVMFAIAAEADRDVLPSSAGLVAELDVAKFNAASGDAEACIKAIKDGADMIYLPADFKGVYEAILNAVNDGTVSEDRLNNAVGNVLTAKGV